MRLILGMILGAALTVGVAYVSDTATKPTTPGAEARPMVNWDVVGRNVDALTTHDQAGLEQADRRQGLIGRAAGQARIQVSRGGRMTHQGNAIHP